MKSFVKNTLIILSLNIYIFYNKKILSKKKMKSKYEALLIYKNIDHL